MADRDPSRRIKIFDTTLRDGQQCPGAGMSFADNVRYAHLAHEVGIDVLEAGFPSASKSDFAIVQTIAKELGPLKDGPVIAGLCQLREAQFDLTLEALRPALAHGKARLHAYLPVDPVLMAASLGERATKHAELVEDVRRFIEKSAASGIEIEFSLEGYSRMGANFDFATDAIRAAVSAGARIINCPDTIGGACRLQGDDYFVVKMKRHAEIMSREFPKIDLTWSVHCHNDMGLALDNSMNGVFQGPARQIEGCINGVGERAGNVALEQCVLYLRQYAEHVDPKRPFYTGIKLERLQAISDFVGAHMLPRQPHYPICGANAAKHTSGGHTNAILKNPLSYQPFDPRDTGKEISFVFGPLSGGNHAKAIVEEFGYACGEDEKAAIAQFIKDLYAERRKGVTDEEVLQGYFEYRAPISLSHFDYARSGEKTTITVQGRLFDRRGEISESAQGSNSALAVLMALINSRHPDLKIVNYSSQSAGAGIEALSVSTIVVSKGDGRALCSGKGEDQDIEISAMKALVAAVNKLLIDAEFKLDAEKVRAHAS
jgi:2-isopropylmalate synthase